jgi:hypothetical protein
VQRIIGPVLFYKVINSESYHRLIISPFFSQLTGEGKLYRHFMQDNIVTYTAINSVDALDEVCGEPVISLGLWPTSSPSLNLCDFVCEAH